MPGRLVVTGLGIQLGRHVTWETRAEIERADRVLYLVADPVVGEWVRRLNPRAESLADCYVEGQSRAIAYDAMVERMLSPARDGLGVCAAFYGHPGVFVFPSHEAIRIARSEGLEARMLPAVSAEDCLFADLGIDPARSGCQSYEATDFLVNERRIDPRSSLILWQAGLVGRIESRLEGFADNRRGLSVLRDVLISQYSSEHEVVIYEASSHVVIPPAIRAVPLSRLVEAEVGPMSTIYVPPLASTISQRMLDRLGLDRAALRVAPPCWEGTRPSPRPVSAAPAAAGTMR
jgi:uncharacterized protein YabN with tetrapyrrole methylase and pyrophosphatase domain